jgi:N-acetylglucosaminyldiphosphoundecaprenol N-acetyl-beta-D-mannosaminyltransferase
LGRTNSEALTLVFRRVNLLGGPVDLVSRDEVITFIVEAVARERKAIIGNQNLHSLELSRRSSELRAFFEAADLIEIDSMPLMHWGRLLGLRLSRSHRSTYLDWRHQFWGAAAKRGWRVFLLGATQSVNAQAISRLESQWPGVAFDGHHGYFDRALESSENTSLLERINEFRPDVLLVGMGMPIQEIWIEQNFAALATGVVLSVGAAFDFEAGAQKPAPRIYGELCLEWLYRLVHNPRRLFRRYLVEPWALLAPALDDVTRRAIARRTAPDRGLEKLEVASNCVPVLADTAIASKRELQRAA